MANWTTIDWLLFRTKPPAERTPFCRRLFFRSSRRKEAHFNFGFQIADCGLPMVVAQCLRLAIVSEPSGFGEKRAVRFGKSKICRHRRKPEALRHFRKAEALR